MTPTASNDVSVDDASVTPDVVVLNSPDSIGVFGDPDRQFVVVTATAGDDPPERDAFELAAGDETYAPMLDLARGLWERDRPYGEADSGWLAFWVPKPLDVTDPVVAWPGGERALESDAVERLSRPPTSFEVRAFDAPSAVQSGEDPKLSVTVENVGDHDGQFVLALNRVGPRIAYAPVESAALDVPAGETTTWEYAGEGHADVAVAEDSSIRYHLNWRDGRRTRTVDIEE